MKLTISHDAAASAACAACAARLFCGLAVDSLPHPGAWLSALVGAALSCPVILAYRVLRRVPLPLRLAILLSNLTVAAGALSRIERSAGYLSLDRSPSWALLMPAALALAWSVSRNGDAAGHAATVWRRVFPLLLAIVVALQLPCYRAVWLRPTLGLGWRAIVEGGVRAAGWISAISGILVLPDRAAQGNRPSGPAAVVIGAGVAALLLLLRLMTTPFMAQGADGGWLTRLDSLLTNGRAPLYLQMPMLLIWYAALLHLSACAGFCAACHLQRMLPSVDGRLCAALAALGAAMATGFAGSPIMERCEHWQYAVLALLCAAALLLQARGGDEPCEKAV